ncbi:MAG: SDR family NAD(P)-dependent oxidoreductase [Planctomycetaceae bacterium]
METNMNEKVALVTGGSSGIGRAIAEAFRAAGARVAITGRRETELHAAAAAIGALPLPGDVRDAGHARRAVDACVEQFGRLTTLVNNAGVIGTGTTADTTPEEWDRVMGINLRGTVVVSRAALPALRKAGRGAGASILNLSSVAGARPYAAVTAYCVSKAAVDMFTRCLALEVAPDAIRVNALAPGVVVTNLHRAGNAVADYPAFLERSKETHPLGFVGESRDIAAFALYLCSDAARWVTGGIFPIDGGRALASAR